MMREKHEDDYAEFEAEVKSATASEASSDEKAATKKPKTKKAKAPKASAAAAAETEDEAEAEEEREEEREEAPTTLKDSECDWKVRIINGTKYACDENTKACWHRNEDKTRGEWAGLYDPETKKLDTSAPEIVITE